MHAHPETAFRDTDARAVQPEPTGLDPADWTALRAEGRAMLETMFDFLEHGAERPVWRAPPQAVRARFREALPLSPTRLADCHATFVADILPYASGNTHPGFMGWVQGGGTPVGMLAEMLAAGLNANLGGRDHMPIEVERQVLAWVREMFDFPDTASGLFVTGTSQANFMAVVIARAKALSVQVRDRGLLDCATRLTAYTSNAAHGCVARAMDLAGLGSDHLRRVEVDADHRIDLGALRRRIQADREAGFTPFLIIGTAGAVDVGAIDDLDALADIAAAETLSFHVDGALGALAVLSPELAPLVSGIQRCDSLAFDFHKWGQVPYDAGFLLVRDGEQHRQTFAADAGYLTRADRGLAAGDWWPCDYGMDLSRGFRALKTWLTLKTYGATALGDSIAFTCALARQLAARIRQEPELTLLAPVALNIVCFSYGDGRHDPEIVADLQVDGEVAPSLTRLDGRPAIRAAIVNHRTRAEHIDALIKGVLDRGRALSRGA